jgi:hypothetical protein
MAIPDYQTLMLPLLKIAGEASKGSSQPVEGKTALEPHGD